MTAYHPTTVQHLRDCLDGLRMRRDDLSDTVEHFFRERLEHYSGDLDALDARIGDYGRLLAVAEAGPPAADHDAHDAHDAHDDAEGDES